MTEAWCLCGHAKKEHGHLENEGSCLLENCACRKFTWVGPTVQQSNLVPKGVTEEVPLETLYADFIVRECAVAGALLVALSALKPLEDLQALSGEELEMLNVARANLHQMELWVLARVDYRRKLLYRVTGSEQVKEG